jgi:hypothetical protein
MRGFPSQKNAKPVIGGAFGWIALLAAISPATSRADFFLHHWELERVPSPGKLEFDGDVLVYSTSSNYDPSGNAAPVTGLSGYVRDEMDATAIYGALPGLSLWGRLTYARVAITETSTGAGDAYGLADQTLGGSWRVYEIKSRTPGDYPIAFDLQGQADIPAYNNTQNAANNLPVLGDGSLDMTAGGFVSVPLYQTRENILQAVVGAGYTYRTLSFSTAIPWSAEVSWMPRFKGLTISAAGVGVQSLKNDPNAYNLGLRGPSYTGGSFIGDAINPSIAALRLKVAYDFSPLIGGTLAYEQSVWGQDAPQGGMLTLGLKVSLGSSSQSGQPGSPPSVPRAGPAQKPQIAEASPTFVKYSLEAKVVRSNDRLNLVKIDKGAQDSVAMGDYFDIYSAKAEADSGAGELVARAQVVAVKENEAALSVRDYYKEVLIDEGFVARKLVR